MASFLSPYSRVLVGISITVDIHNESATLGVAEPQVFISSITIVTLKYISEMQHFSI